MGPNASPGMRTHRLTGSGVYFVFCFYSDASAPCDMARAFLVFLMDVHDELSDSFSHFLFAFVVGTN